MNRQSLPRGFTFVEISLVIIILVLLVAIAVPNFLEANVRAEVSRSRANLAVIAVAVDSYRVDNRMYPASNDPWAAPAETLLLLTTPVSYISTLPRFRSEWKGGERDKYARYINFAQILPEKGLYSDPARGGWSAFAVLTSGPAGEYMLEMPEDGEPTFVHYDPTNGTISRGDLIQFGP